MITTLFLLFIVLRECSRMKLQERFDIAVHALEVLSSCEPDVPGMPSMKSGVEGYAQRTLKKIEEVK